MRQFLRAIALFFRSLLPSRGPKRGKTIGGMEGFTWVEMLHPEDAIQHYTRYQLELEGCPQMELVVQDTGGRARVFVRRFCIDDALMEVDQMSSVVAAVCTCADTAGELSPITGAMILQPLMRHLQKEEHQPAA